MIEREVEFAKTEKFKDSRSSIHAESVGGSTITSSLFLEICDSSNYEEEFRQSFAPEIDGLNKVGSIWISVARLGGANLEGKGERESVFFATFCTVGHNY
jgi:hypothetical protein